MSARDGGPAFPSPTGNQAQDGQLTVRDYFAARALPEAYRRLELIPVELSTARGIAGSIARACYQVADAMMKERQS